MMKGLTGDLMIMHSKQVWTNNQKYLLIAIAFFAMICLAMPTLSAQDKLFDGSRHKLMLSFGYGFDDNITRHADYYYRVYLITFQYQYNIYQKGTFGIDFLTQAQYNITEYAYDVVWVPEKKGGIEFGVHPGILFRKNFWEDELSVFASLVIGPHYITGELNRQVSGFIFSDKFILGVDLKLSKKIYMEMNVGFRHISNAGLDLPNDGINNILANVGLAYLIKSKSKDSKLK